MRRDVEDRVAGHASPLPKGLGDVALADAGRSDE